METFTLGAPRWLVVLVSRNPLIRHSDRVEALVLVLAVVVSLLTLPIAAAVGTAVYDSRSCLYAEQAETQTQVAATVIDNPARRDTTMVGARWFAAGTEHIGAVKAHRTAKPGDSIDIWVDKDGSHVGPPHMSAMNEAVAIALAIWLNVSAVAVLVFAGTRMMLNRGRDAGWQSDDVQLVGGGHGHTSRP